MYVDGCERGERRSPPVLRWCVLAVILLLGILAILLALAGLSRRTSGDLEVTVYGHEMELPSPPPARGTLPPVPAVMMDLFRQGPHEQLPAEIVRSVTPRTIDGLHHRQPQDNAPGREHLHLLTFDLPALIPGEALHSAQLRLTLSYLQPPAVENVTSVVRIYWDTTEASLTQEVHDHEHEKRINFNCTDIIDKFYKLQSSQNAEDFRLTLQLLIGVTLSRELEVPPIVGGTGEDHDKLPLLLLLYSPLDIQNTSNPERNVTRHKRDLAAEEYEEETNKLWPGARSAPTRARGGRFRTFCRRRPLYVEFSEINYDTWIVAPNGYQISTNSELRPFLESFIPDFNYLEVCPQAYQCVGRCMYPLSDHLSPTKHAIIQTLLHSLHPAKTMRPCCVPTRLDSISILYVDAQGVLTYRLSYKDMVVAECGCR